MELNERIGGSTVKLLILVLIASAIVLRPALCASLLSASDWASLSDTYQKCETHRHTKTLNDPKTRKPVPVVTYDENYEGCAGVSARYFKESAARRAADQDTFDAIKNWSTHP